MDYIANYYKAIKLFCGMNRVRLDWKIIRRGVPTGNKAANDRAPTLVELQKLVEYSDPRIKSLVYVMTSGIRLGAPLFGIYKMVVNDVKVYRGQIHVHIQNRSNHSNQLMMI